MDTMKYWHRKYFIVFIEFEKEVITYGYRKSTNGRDILDRT